MAPAAKGLTDATPDRAKSGGFVVRVHEDVRALPDAWPRSGAPGEARCHVFQTVEFLDAWAETFARAERARPLFVEARYDDALCLFVPFELFRHAGARVLTFADDGSADYNAPILFASAIDWTPQRAVELWRAIKAALPPFDVAMLDKMPPDVGGIPNPFHMLGDAANPVSCHLLDLRKSWDEVENTQPFMRTLRKNMRALDRVAPTRLIVARDAQERATVMAALLDQKQRRFEETKVPGFDAQPEKRAFFDQATDAFAQSGTLHLSALYVGEKIVASMWALTHGKRYYAILIGNDAGEWAKFSPGRILYHRVLRLLHDEGFEEMDVGIGDEPWKFEQCDVRIPLSMKIEPVSWRGRLYVARMDAMRRLRGSPLWARVRPLKWIVLRAVRDWRNSFTNR